MSMFRTRIGRERPRRPLWRDLLPILLLLLVILIAITQPFRAEAQSPPPPPPSTPANPTPIPGDTGSTAPAGAPDSTPATAPAAKPANPDDSNVEAEEGPRRAAQPKLSEEEAPEYRESADNNVSFPVDI